MARTPSLNVEKLSELGTERLARLVLDEAARSAPFRKLVNAALAATKGPDAVAKLIDKRLSALERARSFIDWEKVKPFQQDLAATVGSIVGELAPASPAMAVDRLLRFLSTSESVFERIDDSRGQVQELYAGMVESIGDITARIAAPDKEYLADRIMAALGDNSYGYLLAVSRAVADHLDKPALRRWDEQLAGRQQKLDAATKGDRDWKGQALARQVRDVRQVMAEKLGDLDGLIALEASKPEHAQDTIAIAERLLEAGRLKEALDWIRRKSRPVIRYMRMSDLADGTGTREPGTVARSMVEARIIEAQGDKPAAQKLRWTCFEATLDAGALREYVERLGDFEEFDTLDRAFDVASGSKQRYLALEFFLKWPRLDRAARLVIEHRRNWEGRHYDFLAPAAEILEHERPAAATVLYRALLDDILARAKSNAYGAGARHLARLDALAPAAAADLRLAGIDPHAAYRASLRKTHGRKAGFWAVAPKV
ncbi:DUF6880 family protein [Mesorhizobium sp. IMUNJ 23232]|uniref:DUF6880 family protein n=1 Tax=Mesorhizobium sp. IMUNJ 23232 TaxID=3376064 RepID=UPI00378EB269